MARMNDDGSVDVDPLGAAVEAGRMLEDGQDRLDVVARALVSIAESLAVMVQDPRR